MDTNRGNSLREKPVVVIRKKAGPRSSPSTLPQPAPQVPPPVRKAPALVIPPPPPTEAQPPALQPSFVAPEITETGLSKKEREKQARRELLEVMRDRWPQAFPRDYRQVRPLAIGIGKDIAVRLPEHSPRRISSTIGIFQYLARPTYYRAILQGGPRYDLNGQPRGEVTLKEQELARRDLHAFFEQRRRKAAPSTTAPHVDIPVFGVDENKK